MLFSEENPQTGVRFPDTELPNIVRISGVNQFYGDVHVIKDLKLLIEDVPQSGQLVVVLGPSGCGKSTLLRYISGIQKPTSGDVYINEKPVSASNKAGMVFQKYSSLPWLSVLENVCLGMKFAGISKEDREKIGMSLIDKVGLIGHEHKYAKSPNLSGGQLQRVALARSLSVNPDLLLLDEPFGALDAKTRLDMQNLLLKIWRDIHNTVILTTHDISEAVYLAQTIVIMSNAPSNIVEVIHNPLPKYRDRTIKKHKDYIDTVSKIEDIMMSL